jgi:sialate O-acetylesterase
MSLITTVGLAAESLWLPSIFAESMVLQREMPVPVWGRAKPGATVAVAFYDGGKKLAAGEASAVADTGRWRVDLPALPTGGRYTLLIEAKGKSELETERRMFSNVLVGEVWLFCGQSNMMHPMNACAERDDAIARRHEFPLIRFAQVGHRATHEITEPQEEVQGYWGPIKWEDASYLVPRSSATDISGSCSAAGYFFARALSDTLGRDVPVALIEVGAILPAETWVDPELAAAVPELKHLLGKIYPNATGRGFMSNIVPLAPYACRGVMYYQGEMNAGRARDYYHGLKTLIASWRKAWARPDLPFLVVQLPGYMGSGDGNHPRTPLDMPAEMLKVFDGRNVGHPYCFIREAQLRVSRELPKVGLAVIIDKGDQFDIHPARKRPVGERLALQARKLAYGDKQVVADGPLPREFQRKGERFVIRFDGLGGGLLAAEGGLKSFEIRDAAGAWHPALAEIKGDTVTVRAANVAEPAGVRYAWAGFPEVTLFNKEGLPATPFQYPPPDL